MQHGNLDLLYLSSRLCEISYFSEMRIISESKKLGFDVKPITFDKDSLFIGESSDMNIIVFRGLDNINDIKDCVKIDRELTEANIPVHSGLYKRFLNLWNFVFPYLNVFYKNEKKILICGHSLGGVMSLLFSMQMHDFFKRDISVITFATPYVGKSKWKRFMNNKIRENQISITNVVHRQDAITKIPLWIFGWRRPGSLFKLGDFNLFNIFKEIPIAHKIIEYKRLLKLELNKI